MSPQSLSPSHCHRLLMHRPLVHLNCVNGQVRAANMHEMKLKISLVFFSEHSQKFWSAVSWKSDGITRSTVKLLFLESTSNFGVSDINTSASVLVRVRNLAARCKRGNVKHCQFYAQKASSRERPLFDYLVSSHRKLKTSLRNSVWCLYHFDIRPQKKTKKKQKNHKNNSYNRNFVHLSHHHSDRFHHRRRKAKGTCH